MTKKHHLPSIIVTMGPSLAHKDVLDAIIATSPISYVRFNMSHGSHEEHYRRVQLVRECAETHDKKIKTFIDLCGPKIRVTHFLGGEHLALSENTLIKIVPKSNITEQNQIAISYEDIYKHVTPSSRIAFDDGKLLAQVISVEGDVIYCRVTQGGVLLQEKGINILDTDLPIPALTDKDKEDIIFAIEHGFDAISLSFVKRKEDLLELKHYIQEHTDRYIPCIAKIETKEALHEIEGILEEADILMVARGDLGIEVPLEKIPLIQKELLFLANEKNVPAIVATEMLKSMVEHPFPTRAEITDCANALIDGAEYLMLSDETTIGKYPEKAVAVMASLVYEYIQHKESYRRVR